MGVIARALEYPIGSTAHHDISDHLWMCGKFMVARYYLSVLTGTPFDFDDVSQSKFLDALSGFLTKNVSPDAIAFCVDSEGEGMVAIAVLPTLRQLYFEHTGLKREPPRKNEEKALVMLVGTPSLTDAQIQSALKTTTK
ncbi:MAG: hypothetical protein R3C10_21140 [Pirellulales bacterium]